MVSTDAYVIYNGQCGCSLAMLCQQNSYADCLRVELPCFYCNADELRVE